MKSAFPAAYHRDAHGFLVKHVFAFHSVSAHADAVVGREDEEGILTQVAVFQGLYDASHLFVHSGDAGVVVADVRPEIIAFGSPFLWNKRFLSGQCLHVERVVQPFVFIGHQLVSRVRGIHGNHQGKGAVGLHAFRADELDGAVGLVDRSPLVHVMEFVSSRQGIPVHRMQVVVVGAVRNPSVEAVAAFGWTPFVPGHCAPVVVGIHVGRMRCVEVPFADVGRGITRLFQHVAPANRFGGKFHSVRCVQRVAVACHPIGHGIHARHEHGPGGRGYRIAAHGLREEDAFACQLVQMRSLHRFLLQAAQRIAPELVGHDEDQVGTRRISLCGRSRWKYG